MQMKKILYTISAVLLTAACTQPIVDKIDYSITLSPENSYTVGEPVVFNIEGNVENLVFYSGETGRQYQYAHRYEVSQEDISSAVFTLKNNPRDNSPEGVEIYVSKTFEGLKGNDGDADRATLKAMYDDGMKEWKQFEFVKGEYTKWGVQEFDISDMLDGKLTFALHWCPKLEDGITPNDGSYTQSSYWIDGDIAVDIKGIGLSTTTFANMAKDMKNSKALATTADSFFKVVNMNEEREPYMVNQSVNGYVSFTKSAAPITFQGVGANKLDYGIDTWLISSPMVFNKVDNDKGEAIKAMDVRMDTYSYTWNEPGTYKVTFVGCNANFAGSSRAVKEFDITIVDTVPEK